MVVNVLYEWGCYEVDAMAVYKDMFCLGSGLIQRSDEESGQYKANPLIYYKNDDEEKGHYRVLFEDTFEEVLRESQQADFTLINGITYFGRKNVQQYASKMFAMIFDLDNVNDETVSTLMSRSLVAKVYPCPNYIILSGSGLHLYYLFEEPLSLFPNIKLQLKELKYALTDILWTKETSLEEKKQHQGINQGFKVIGGKTKPETSWEKRVRAFRVREQKYKLSELCKYVSEKYWVDEEKRFKESKYTLEEAKRLFPKWYDKVIINGDKTPIKWDIAEKVNGQNPYALYDWWLKNIRSGALYGHRYFCIMALVIYAVKNNVPYDKVVSDALSLRPFLEALNPNKPFTEADINSALECYDDRYCTFTRSDISRLTAIDIKPNKRNYRSQEKHMEYMRGMKQLKKQIGECVNEGRPAGKSKQREIIKEWRMNNPEGRQVDCVRSTGISRSTVRKWWL